VTHAEDNRRRHGFHGRRHAGARFVDWRQPVAFEMRAEIEPKGEITMRKVVAMNYVTHDGVMQSPGAFR
jgi:hypothetical protein